MHRTKLIKIIRDTHDLLGAGDIDGAKRLISDSRFELFQSEELHRLECVLDTASLVFDVYSTRQLQVKYGINAHQLSKELEGVATKRIVNCSVEGRRISGSFYIFNNVNEWKQLKPGQLFRKWENGHRSFNELTEEQLVLAKPSPTHSPEEII